MNKIKEIENLIIIDKMQGLSDKEIGEKYKISYRQLETILRKHFGLSISSFNKEKKIKSLIPKDFQVETITVWSFKRRGDWATHSGEYRGNWSPYIPRNIILKYSEAGDIVLDHFCGSGTTAIEAKLLGRRCIAIDINEKAIELAKKKIYFSIPKNQILSNSIFEPELRVGDARDLSFLEDDSIDLICAHPPYANIIHYTNHKEGDLSFYDTKEFLNEMEKVAKESFRVLKPGHSCAILIGDIRKHKNIIPLGFMLIHIFMNVGFKLKELVIKRQHNCKTTGFWYENSIKYNFLLIAHEYLPIFEKPTKRKIEKEKTLKSYSKKEQHTIFPEEKKFFQLETSSVWIFPENEFDEFLNRNVIERYSSDQTFRMINFSKNLNLEKKEKNLNSNEKLSLLFIKSFYFEDHTQKEELLLYLEKLKSIITIELPHIKNEGYCIIQTKDHRSDHYYVEPIAKYVVDHLKFPQLFLKEIIIVTVENDKAKFTKEINNLEIVHQYLLVYKILNNNI